MSVRVVPVMGRVWPSFCVSLAGGAALLGYTTTHSPHADGALAIAGATGMVWMLGLFLSWRRRPYVGRVTKRGRHLVLGREVVPSGATASVVAAELGASVALVWGRHAIFVETASLDDANALVRAAGALVGEEVTLRTPVRAVARAKQLAAALGVLSGFLLATEAFGTDAFGALVICGAIASILHLVEALARRRIVLGATSGFEAAEGTIKNHVLLHIRRPSGAREPAPARVRVLTRGGGEELRAWLARIDTLGNDAYRGDLPPRDDLEELVADPASALDARLAAARVLLRRYGVPRAEVERRLDATVAPYFSAIGDDDLDEVLEGVARPGPVFRA